MVSKLRGFQLALPLIAIIMALIGCSTVPVTKEAKAEPKYVRPTSNPSSLSIHQYVMGELALSEGNYHVAIMLFKQADNYDQKNVTIKERLLEAYLYTAEMDTTFYKKTVDLGEPYLENSFITPKIYRFTGQACLSEGLIDRGIELLKAALEIDPNPYYFYDLFIVIAQYKQRVESVFLERALQMSWDNRAMINAIAEIYEHYSPLRSKEILEEAYKLYENDNESLSTLLEFYTRFRDWGNFIKVVGERLATDKPTPENYKQLYLQRLVHYEDYKTIADAYEYFAHYDDYLTQRIMLYALFYEGKYELALEVGKKIETMAEFGSDDLQEDKKVVFLYIGKTNYYLNNYDGAVKYLSKIEDPTLLCSVIQALQEIDNRLDVESFTQDMVLNGMEPVIRYLTLAVFKLRNNELEKTKEYLETAINLSQGSDELWLQMAVTFLGNNMEEEALSTLAQVKEENFDENMFIGDYYYYSEMDSLAGVYFEKSIESNPAPSVSVYLSLASIYNRNNRSSDEIALMENAMQHHQDNPQILNWLGYSLVVQSERLNDAEKYLLKALELEPDSQHIQDSVAWLYYTLEDYEKALSYMENIIQTGIDDTIISYHIGMIFLKLRDLTQAEEYFKMAIQLDNDEEHVNKAKNTLLLIGESDE